MSQKRLNDTLATLLSLRSIIINTIQNNNSKNTTRPSQWNSKTTDPTSKYWRSQGNIISQTIPISKKPKISSSSEQHPSDNAHQEEIERLDITIPFHHHHHSQYIPTPSSSSSTLNASIDESPSSVTTSTLISNRNLQIEYPPIERKLNESIDINTHDKHKHIILNKNDASYTPNVSSSFTLSNPNSNNNNNNKNNNNSIHQERLIPPSTISENTSDSKYELKQSRIPSSRISRLWHYGGNI